MIAKSTQELFREFRVAELFERAKVVAQRYHQKLDELQGKRIRVLRAIEYEGEAEAVFKQLAGSLPPGEKDIGKVIIRVVEDHHVKVIE